MKSACCKHEIVIQTDPKNCEYVIISGAQKKTEDFDIEDAETFELPADEGVYYNSISEYFWQFVFSSTGLEYGIAPANFIIAGRACYQTLGANGCFQWIVFIFLLNLVLYFLFC